jgi:hypothetical protein
MLRTLEEILVRLVQIPPRSELTTGGGFGSLNNFVSYFKNKLGPRIERVTF